MQIVQKIMSSISLYLVGIAFFVLANIVVITQIFQADTIKKTLDEQGTYKKIVPTLLATAHYSNSTDLGQLPLQAPWVQDAATKAFSADDLQKQTDQAIDNTFKWLNGDTNKLEFTLDLTGNKQQLGQEVANYTGNTLSNLPRCTTAQQTFDAFAATCLPYGVSTEQIKTQVQSDIANSQDFLQNPVITSQNFGTSTNTQNLDPAQSLAGIRSFYKNRGLFIGLLAAAIVVLAGVGILVAPNRITAVGKLSRTFFSTTVSLSVFAAILYFGSNALVGGAARDRITKDIVAPVISDLVHKAALYYLLFAVAALCIGIALYIIRKRLSVPKSVLQ